MIRRIPFVDLTKSYISHKKDIHRALKKVLEGGSFILGEEVRLFEQEFARYLHSTYAIGVASGTDALILALKALGIQARDEVLLPVNSYPTVFAITAIGATPKFVDINPITFTIDASLIEELITSKTKAIVVVHLYGYVADMKPILSLAKKYNLFVIEDVAQAHGAEYNGKKAGTLGHIGCFSFYPTKNLACFGDGGMITTNSKRLAIIIKQLRIYGEKTRYKSVRLGINSRLDEIQAAILRIKLKKLDEWNRERQTIAKSYIDAFRNTNIVSPSYTDNKRHVFHLFVIRTKKRNKLKTYLQTHGVETGIHFPTPTHLVPALSHFPYKKGDFPITEKVSREILSLPCYPGLKKNSIKTICNLITNFLQ